MNYYLKMTTKSIATVWAQEQCVMLPWEVSIMGTLPKL